MKNHTRAVVGNSWILANSTMGEEIDAHHAVIRLNDAPVAGTTKEKKKKKRKKTSARAMRSLASTKPYTLYPIPYTLYPIPQTLYPIPYLVRG